jgi:hypothetical protein
VLTFHLYIFFGEIAVRPLPIFIFLLMFKRFLSFIKCVFCKYFLESLKISPTLSFKSFKFCVLVYNLFQVKSLEECKDLCLHSFFSHKFLVVSPSFAVSLYCLCSFIKYELTVCFNLFLSSQFSISLFICSFENISFSLP